MKSRAYLSLIIGLSLLICSCHHEKKPHVSTLNSKIEQSAIRCMENEVFRTNADSAFIVLSSVATGEVLTYLRMVKKGYNVYLTERQSEKSETEFQPGSLFYPFSILAAMQNGDVSLTDTVDTGKGIYSGVKGFCLKDDCWNKGGHGTITIRQCLELPSLIGVTKTTERVFDKNPVKFVRALKSISIGSQVSFGRMYCGDSTNDDDLLNYLIDPFSFGYELSMTPLQMITCYNAIANRGKMMKPVFYADQDSIISRKICTEKAIGDLHRVFCETYNQYKQQYGLKSSKVIAGYSGHSELGNAKCYSNLMGFYGYFPASQPQYSCLVLFCKKQKNNYEPVKGSAIYKSPITVFDQIVRDL